MSLVRPATFSEKKLSSSLASLYFDRTYSLTLDAVVAESLARATLGTSRSSRHATRVHDLLARRGLLDGLPVFLALRLRAYGAAGCEARKAVLREIAAASHPRMQPFLRRFRNPSGCSPLGFGDGWAGRSAADPPPLRRRGRLGPL